MNTAYTDKKILIVGGYGAVGSEIAHQLSRHYPGRLVIAGRNLKKAGQLAEKLNNAVETTYIDINAQPVPSLFDNVCLVIMCIDQINTGIAAFCAQNGIHYTDITANRDIIQRLEELNLNAIQSGCSMIISTGLAPGLTNLLARHCLTNQPQISSLNIFILLGLGEKHGEAAYEWTLNNIDTRYDICINGKHTALNSFTQPKSSDLLGKRTFYLFNFSDQHTLLKTTGVEHILTRLAFDSQAATAIIAFLRKTRITRFLKNKKLQKLIIPIFQKAGIGSEVYGIKVTGYNNSGLQYECSLTGYGEGQMTAYAATEIALGILNNEFPAGVRHSDQAINNVAAFLNNLKKYDPDLKLNL